MSTPPDPEEATALGIEVAIDPGDLPTSEELIRELNSPSEEVVVPAERFIETLCELVRQAEDHITLNFMEIHWKDALTEDLYNALLFKKVECPQIPITIAYSKRSVSDRFARFREHTLANAGINLIHTDRWSPWKDMRTNHRKLISIDDIWGIGGVNPHNETLNSIDMMYLARNSEISDQVNNTIHSHLGNSRPYHKDPVRSEWEIIPVDDDSTILLENGKSDRESVIIDEAVALIERCVSGEKVWIASQWVPNHKVLDALLSAASKGVEVHIITNKPEYFHGRLYEFSAHFGLRAFRFIKWLRARYPSDHELNQNLHLHLVPNRLHAKLLMTSRGELMLGSENFISLGVYLMTRESMLKSSSPTIYKKVSSRMMQMLRKAGEELIIDDNDRD